MNNHGDIKTSVNRGLAWIAGASSMIWVLDIIGMFTVLALWIPPEQMGIAALAIPFFPALDVASEMGLGAAVIQRDDLTDDKVSTVFWLNGAIILALAGLLALVIGPVLGSIHEQPVVGWMFAAYGGKLVWHNTYLIPRALMRRELRFKELSVIRTLANVAEFVGKVGFAWAGFGIWCFVLGPMCRAVVSGIGVQICHPWRPRFVFKLTEALDWAIFGIKAAGSQLVYHVYTNVDYQIVGYLFTREATGFYWFAYELVLKPCFLIGQTVQPIAFAAYSRLKHERERLIDQFVAFTRLSLVVILTFLALILVSSDEILRLIWGESAVPAATAARILCAVGVLRAVSFVIPPLLDGVGRPGLSLIYNLSAAILLPLSFWLCAKLFGDSVGYLSVAIGWAIGYPIAFVFLVVIALVIMELKAMTFARRIMGIPLCATAAIAASSAVRYAASGLPDGLKLLVATVAAISVFGGLLAYTQGISPRSIVRSVRGESPAAAG